jgi:hypothetical protein
MIARSRYSGRDVLVERGRSWRRDGAEVRKYTCGWDRISASVCGERIALRRKLGVVCPGLDIVRTQLSSLIAFLRWWERHRTRWSAFYWTGAGHPPGWSGATAYYQPAGSAQKIRVAMKCIDGLRGDDFTGRDIYVPVRPPHRVGGVAILLSRVIRREERLGERRGEEVGGVYRCGQFRVDASRNSVTIKRGRNWVDIEPGEWRFFERLLAIEGLTEELPAE